MPRIHSLRKKSLSRTCLHLDRTRVSLNKHWQTRILDFFLSNLSVESEESFFSGDTGWKILIISGTFPDSSPRTHIPWKAFVFVSKLGRLVTPSSRIQQHHPSSPQPHSRRQPQQPALENEPVAFSPTSFRAKTTTDNYNDAHPFPALIRQGGLRLLH